MSIKGGPKIETDGLVLYYGVNNIKSYPGEPTTNLIIQSGQDFSELGGYTGITDTQVVDSESPSGYACKQVINDVAVNVSSRIKFGLSNPVPTSGQAFVSVWAKIESGTWTSIVPKMHSGADWYTMAPLDGGSSYLTTSYRRFGVSISLGTASGGPNPAFSMTIGNANITLNDTTYWHSPQLEMGKAHATQFLVGTRSATDGLKDLSRNGAHGDLTNTDFNSDAEIYYNDSGNIDISDALPFIDNTLGTISIWFNTSVNQRGALVGFGDGTTIWGAFELGASTGESADEYLSFYTNVSTLQMILRDTDTSNEYLLCDGVWHNVVGVAGNGDNSIYLDGVKMSVTFVVGASTTTGNVFLYSANNTIFRIGDSTYNGGHIPFGGKIDNVKIYNRALTSKEILDNYNAQKSRFGR